MAECRAAEADRKERVGNTINRHHCYRLGLEHPISVQLTTVQEHLREAEEVHRGGHQADSALNQDGLLGEGDLLHLVRPEFTLAGRTVDRGKAIGPLGFDPESGVRHAEWPENALLEVIFQWLTRPDFDKPPQDRGRDAVPPVRARILEQGCARRIVDHLLDGNRA